MQNKHTTPYEINRTSQSRRRVIARGLLAEVSSPAPYFYLSREVDRMTNQTPTPDLVAQEEKAYDLRATSYCKVAIAIWCLVGWIYAAYTWHLLWLPGILVFLPGIFVASLVAFVFFFPSWLIMRKDWRDFTLRGKRRNGLLLFAIALKSTGYLIFFVVPVVYVNVLRKFLNQ